MADHLMRDSRSRWSDWILGCVLPARDLDAVTGDLMEEYALRLQSTTAAQAHRWYWGQISRSLPSLLWSLVRRGGCLATLAVAIGACLVQASVELATKTAISSLIVSDPRVSGILTLVVALPSLVFVSYRASRIRPGAATVFAALILFAVVVQLVVKESAGMSVSKQIAALVVAPSAAFAGGVVFLRSQIGSRSN